MRVLLLIIGISLIGSSRVYCQSAGPSRSTVLTELMRNLLAKDEVKRYINKVVILQLNKYEMMYSYGPTVEAFSVSDTSSLANNILINELDEIFELEHVFFYNHDLEMYYADTYLNSYALDTCAKLCNIVIQIGQPTQGWESLGILKAIFSGSGNLDYYRKAIGDGLYIPVALFGSHNASIFRREYIFAFNIDYSKREVKFTKCITLSK